MKQLELVHMEALQGGANGSARKCLLLGIGSGAAFAIGALGGGPGLLAAAVTVYFTGVAEGCI